MSDTLITGQNVEVVQTGAVGEGQSAFSWAAVIAGALAAAAVSLILMALGTGIGLSVVSPWGNNPSPTTLSVMAAVWLVFAWALGFGTGGYLAGRLRTQNFEASEHEANFRDGAHGFVVWALGVVMMAAVGTAAGFFTLGLGTHAAATVTAGAASGAGSAAGGRNAADPSAYFVDTLFRTAPGTGGAGAPTTGAPAAGTPGQDAETRAEIGRILTSGMRNDRLSDEDRAYIGRVVGARTGLSPEEANRRVDDVVNRYRESVKQAADTARKAAAYTAFWSFMALLIGAAAATVGGIVGGNQRDEELGLTRV